MSITLSKLSIAPLLIMGIVALISGCQQSSQRERSIPLKPNVALTQARSVLQNYANGSPLTSEVDGFDNLVESVRKEDPAAAETLAAAFKKIKANPGSRVRIAKDTLEKLPEPAPIVPGVADPPNPYPSN